jgi:hypothetical protein
MKVKHWPTLLDCQSGRFAHILRRLWLAEDSILDDLSHSSIRKCLALLYPSSYMSITDV